MSRAREGYGLEERPWWGRLALLAAGCVCAVVWLWLTWRILYAPLSGPAGSPATTVPWP